MAAARRDRAAKKGVAASRQRRGPFGEHFLRTSIVQAATRVFTDKGIADATVEDILGEADVSRRTFYRFFGNKESVLEAIHEMAMRLLVDGMREASASVVDLAAKTEASVDVFLRMSQAAGPLLAMMGAEAQKPGSRLASRRSAMFDAVAGVIEEQMRGQGREPPDRLMLVGVISAVEGIAHRVYDRKLPDPALVERARTAMIRIVRAALAEPGDEVPPLPRGA